MSDQLKAVLEALHTQLAEELLRRVKNGECTAADLAVARQFLKDNNIDSIPVEGSPTHSLALRLPFEGEEEEQTIG